jgi:hypothetical protein
MAMTIDGSNGATFPDSTLQATALTTGAVTRQMINTSTANGMGICRAWVTFVGSTGAITASYNVSSVTRSSAGQYIVNFTTAMPDALYSTLVMFQPTVNNAGSDNFAINPTTTNVELNHWEDNVRRNSEYSCVAIFR